MRDFGKALTLGFLVLLLPGMGYGEADIIIDQFAAPPYAEPGQPIGDQFILRVFNPGPDNITTGFSVGFYVSTDDQVTLGDQLLIGGREFVPALLAGQMHWVSLFSGARIPPDCPEGPAFLGVVVDEFDQFEETDETNNTAASAVEVGTSVSATTKSWDSVKQLYR